MILLASYPRSGNTLLRSYVEKIMGLWTGSDCDMDRPLNRQLQEMGMQGEGIVDDSVWIVKSHFPERIGTAEINTNKVIIITRSPIDSITSLFNMIGTSSHTESIDPKVFTEKAKLWDEFIRQEIEVWQKFHEHYLKAPQQVPTYIVRYEDLILDPETVLEKLFCFLLNQSSLEGLTIKELIKLAIDEEAPATVYKPRLGKINANKHLFTITQLRHMRRVAYQSLRRLGYMNLKGVEN